MKVSVATLFVLLACASADSLRRPTQVQGSDCIDSVVAFAGDVYNVVKDVKTLIGGDTTVIPTLISDVETAIASFKTVESSCGLGAKVEINAQCLSDITAIVSTIKSLGADIAALVKGDISQIQNIISGAKSLVTELQTAKTDCLS